MARVVPFFGAASAVGLLFGWGIPLGSMAGEAQDQPQSEVSGTIGIDSAMIGGGGIGQAPHRIPPQVIPLPDAGGPPQLSCKEALGLVLREPTDPPEKPKPKPTEPPPPPDTSGMVELTIGGELIDVAGMPGGVPAELPLVLLEGAVADLQKIAEVWRRAAQGETVRLSFFGASHTEGDYWTGRIRRVLQERWGDAGHGFVMPAAPVQGYRASDINLCRTPGWRGDWSGARSGHQDGFLGFAGMSVSSSDPDEFAWIETTRVNPQGQKMSVVQLFVLGQPGGGTILVRVDDEEIVSIPTEVEEYSVLRAVFQLPDDAHRVALAPAGDGEVRILGMSAERDVPGVIVDAMGIRGRTARTWLNWNREHANNGLATLEPDLVVLAYGTNEANDRNYEMDRYASDLRAVLTELRVAQPSVACVLVGPSDRGLQKDEETFAIFHRTEMVAQVQRQVAPEFGCAFWDWQQATGGPGSQIAWRFTEPRLASNDLIHFTRDGYEWVADRFIAAIDYLVDPDGVREVFPQIRGIDQSDQHDR